MTLPKAPSDFPATEQYRLGFRSAKRDQNLETSDCPRLTLAEMTADAGVMLVCPAKDSVNKLNGRK